MASQVVVAPQALEQSLRVRPRALDRLLVAHRQSVVATRFRRRLRNDRDGRWAVHSIVKEAQEAVAHAEQSIGLVAVHRNLHSRLETLPEIPKIRSHRDSKLAKSIDQEYSSPVEE